MPLSGKELKVVVLAPVGRDARLLRDALTAGGLNAQTASTLADALPHLEEATIGALLLTEEVLDQGNIALLSKSLEGQPEWSDIPILILTVGGSATKLSRRREQDRLPLGSVTLLERPLRRAPLLSSVRSALRSRRRQLQVRDTLIERDRAAADRSRAEGELREREEQLRALISASHNAVYEMSADWSVMFQLSGDDFLVDTDTADPDWLRKYIHPLDHAEVLESIQTAIAAKKVFDLEHRVLREDGSIAWTHSRAIPILDGNSQVRKWFGAAGDISDRKRMEVALRQREKLAAVGQIASTIAHEINNPLESVTNLLYLAKSSNTEPHQIVEYLDMAEIELRRVAAITSRTLDFHKQVSHPTNVAPANLFAATLTTYQGRIQNSELQVQVRNRTAGTFSCVEGEIQQVLNNLIGNAIDAMRQHGGKLILRSAEIFDWKTRRSFIRLTIADTGSGIPDDIIGEVFNPFFTTKGIGGTGLGLWISRDIIEAHKGRLKVRSSTRKDHTGTVFTLLLPK